MFRFEDEGRTEVRLDGGDGGGFKSQDLTGGTPCAFSVPSIVTVRYLSAIAATTIGRVPNPSCPR